MEEQVKEEYIKRYLDLKKKGGKIDRVITYALYNELLKPKKRRSHKDCTCRDRDTDYKVANWLEKNYKEKVEDPLPVESNVKIELEGLTKPKPKVKRKRRTTKKKNEGTKSNGVSTNS